MQGGKDHCKHYFLFVFCGYCPGIMTTLLISKYMCYINIVCFLKFLKASSVSDLF